MVEGCTTLRSHSMKKGHVVAFLERRRKALGLTARVPPSCLKCREALRRRRVGRSPTPGEGPARSGSTRVKWFSHLPPPRFCPKDPGTPEVSQDDQRKEIRWLMFFGDGAPSWLPGSSFLSYKRSSMESPEHILYLFHTFRRRILQKHLIDHFVCGIVLRRTTYARIDPVSQIEGTQRR